MRRGPGDAHRSVRGLRGDPVRLGWARRPPLGVVVLGLLAYVPALSAGRGRMPADTKLYLYLDPGRLVSDAPYTFDGRQFAGWVPHQTISYLWPSGPWYWLFDAHRRARLDRAPVVDRHDPVRRRARRALARPPARDRRYGGGGRGGCVPAVAIRAALPLTYLADAAARTPASAGSSASRCSPLDAGRGGTPRCSRWSWPRSGHRTRRQPR